MTLCLLPTAPGSLRANYLPPEQLQGIKEVIYGQTLVVVFPFFFFFFFADWVLVEADVMEPGPPSIGSVEP